MCLVLHPICSVDFTSLPLHYKSSHPDLPNTWVWSCPARKKYRNPVLLCPVCWCEAYETRQDQLFKDLFTTYPEYTFLTLVCAGRHSLPHTCLICVFRLCLFHFYTDLKLDLEWHIEKMVSPNILHGILTLYVIVCKHNHPFCAWNDALPKIRKQGIARYWWQDTTTL